MQSRIFTQCSSCQKSWNNYEEFLSDPDIKLFGYQATLEKLEAGLFYFRHSCNHTIKILAEVFIPLYDGLIFKENLLGTDKCPKYCLHKYDFEACPLKCECAYVLEVLQIIKNWPK